MWPVSLRPAAGNLPGAGFFVLVLSYLGALAFIWFGAQTPTLDHAFEILAKRDRGVFTAFTEPEVKLLRGVLSDHSGFSRALVGRGTAKFLEPRINGWLTMTDAHLAVRPDKDKPTQLRIESQGNPQDYPIMVTLSGSGKEISLKLTSNEPVPLEWGPNELKKATIFGFKVTPSVHGQPSNTWGLRVSVVASSNRVSP